MMMKIKMGMIVFGLVIKDLNHDLFYNCFEKVSAS